MDKRISKRAEAKEKEPNSAPRRKKSSFGSFRSLFRRSSSRKSRAEKREEEKKRIIKLAMRPNYYMKSLEYYFVMKKNDYFAEIYKKHFQQTHNSMKFIKLLDRKKAEKFVRENKLNLKKSPFYLSKILKFYSLEKKTVVLDLDETLVHCSQNNIGDHKLKIAVGKDQFLEVSPRIC